jgi:RsiW-degrading membrane proteinase PrsW (M82 family)
MLFIGLTNNNSMDEEDIIMKIFLLLLPFLLTALIMIYYFDNQFIKLLTKIFVSGMIISLPILYFESILLSFRFKPLILYELYKAVLVTGFLEEISKRYIVLTNTKAEFYYQEKDSGVVYAVVSALGFVTLENIFMLLIKEFSLSVSLISLIGHLIFAIFMGNYLTMSRQSLSIRKRKYYFKMSLVVPIVLHGLFDFIINIDAYIILLIFFIVLVILLGLIYYKLAIINFIYTKKNKSS